MCAISDAVLVPLLDGSYSSHEAEEAEAKSAGLRGAKAAEICAQVFAKYPSRSAEMMPCVKEAMLVEIVRDWGMAHDEAEADKLINFVLDLKLEYKDEEIREAALRKGTDVQVVEIPAHRIERAIAYVALRGQRPYGTGSGFDNKLIDILKLAWAKSSCFRFAGQLFKAAEPIRGATDSAWELVCKMTKQIAALERAAYELKRAMGNADPAKHVWGEIAISYPDMNMVEIKVDVPMHGLCDENHAHIAFEIAQKHARSWRESHPDIRLNLCLEARRMYDKEPRVRRELKF